MKSITIQGQKRESVGKASTRDLRNAEQVPCVVYGESEPLHFSATEKSFKNLVYTPNAHFVNLEVDGTTIQAILQDIQFHPVSDKILHADFLQIKEDKAISMNIPVTLTGRSEGVSAGGALQFFLRKVRVSAIPSKMPENLEIDITPLKIGNKVYISSLQNDDYTFEHPDNAVVVAVRMSRAAMSADTGEEGEEGEEGAEEGAEEASAE